MINGQEMLSYIPILQVCLVGLRLKAVFGQGICVGIVFSGNDKKMTKLRR